MTETETDNHCESRIPAGDHRAPSADATTWVLTTKRVGDKVAGWVIDSLEEGNIRCLESSERCEVTSFCYPTGAKVVRARLLKVS